MWSPQGHCVESQRWLGGAHTAERQIVGQTTVVQIRDHILAGFSREDFECSADPRRLCVALQERLVPRLQAATDRIREARAIVDDLRQAGHELWSWDESDDLSIWCDDYGNPPRPTRFLIEMRWPSPDDPTEPIEVAVTFGPWPGRQEA
jgi:hypothetical protein